MANFKEDLSKVKAFVFDVDGVFSAQVLINSDGELLRMMNVKDGYAVQYAIKQGFPVCIISGGKSESVRIRFKSLGITDIYLGSTNKIEDFKDFTIKYDIKADHVLFMGDDVPDLEILKIVGIPTCPADAVADVKMVSNYISDKKAGEGCVRDVIEQVLRAQRKW
jgi:3-deoxy-D-manno-octulosonate 8-phosphate phosphatase (KDO 8-P phosphatase)